MNLSFTKQPEQISLSGNPVLYGIQTPFSPNKETALNLYLAPVTPGYRDDFSIDVDGSPHVFSNDPGGAGDVYSTNDELLTLFRSVLGYYMAVYLIDATFQLSGIDEAQTDVFVFVKKPGWNGTVAFSVAGGDSVTNTQYDNVSIATLMKFYRIRCDIYAYITDSYALIAEDTCEVNTSGVCNFNIQEFLQNQLKDSYYDFARTWADSNYILPTDQSLMFKCEFSEEYTTDSLTLTSEEAELTSSGLIALVGGLSDEQYNSLVNASSSFYAMLVEYMFFLSWCPDYKYITETMPESLFFMMLEATANGKFMVDINYTDGTADNGITLQTYEFTQYQVYELKADYTILADVRDITKIVKDYSIWIEAASDATAWSEVKSYSLDTGYHYLTRYLKFRNSLGTWDTLLSTGKHENANEYERVLFQQSINNINQSKSKRAEEKETYSGNVGFTETERKKLWYRELLTTDECYMIEQGDAFARDYVQDWGLILITNTKAFITKDKERPFDLQIEYQKSYKGSHVSLKFPEDLLSSDGVRHFFLEAVTDGKVRDLLNHQDGQLVDANCFHCTLGAVLRFPDVITINPLSLTYAGTCRLTVINNQIVCTLAGTCWNLRFTDNQYYSYQFPMCEGYHGFDYETTYLLHGIRRTYGNDTYFHVLAWGDNIEPALQSDWFWMSFYGGDRNVNLVTDKTIWYPKNHLGERMYCLGADDDYYNADFIWTE